MQAVSEGGASRVAVQLVGGAGAGDRQRDAAGARDDPRPAAYVLCESVGVTLKSIFFS